MKNRFGLLFLAFGITLSVSGCASFDKDITVVAPDGTSTVVKYREVNVKSEFKYEAPEIEGKYFMGCYLEQDLNSLKIVEYTGTKMSNIKEMPNKMYAMYIDKDAMQTITKEYEGVDISASNPYKTYEFKLDTGYEHYFGNKDVMGYLNVRFSHFEKEEGVSGVNTFNWANYRLENSLGMMEEGVYRDNHDYSTFSRMYQVEKSQAFKALKFFVGRPDACISTAPSSVTGFKMTFYLGTEEQLKEVKYSNLIGGNSGVAIYSQFENSSATINNSYSTGATLDYDIPFNVHDWIEESTTESIKISVTASNYGDKLLLFSNWIDCTLYLTDKYKVTSKFENNQSGGDSDTLTLTIPLDVAIGLKKITIKLIHPDSNASSAFYYVWDVSFTIRRV